MKIALSAEFWTEPKVNVLVSVPKKNNFKGEAMHTVTGTINGEMLVIHQDGQSISEISRGNSITGILCTPIWKV